MWEMCGNVTGERPQKAQVVTNERMELKTICKGSAASSMCEIVQKPCKDRVVKSVKYTQASAACPKETRIAIDDSSVHIRSLKSK